MLTLEGNYKLIAQVIWPSLIIFCLLHSLTSSRCHCSVTSLADFTRIKGDDMTGRRHLLSTKMLIKSEPRELCSMQRYGRYVARKSVTDAGFSTHDLTQRIMLRKIASFRSASKKTSMWRRSDLVASPVKNETFTHVAGVGRRARI